MCEWFNHCVLQKKQSFGEWDVNRTAQWLSSLSLYDCIPQEYAILLVKSPCQSQITDILNRMRFYPINCLFLQLFFYLFLLLISTSIFVMPIRYGYKLEFTYFLKSLLDQWIIVLFLAIISGTWCIFLLSHCSVTCWEVRT